MADESIFIKRKKVIAECIGVLSLEWARLEFTIDGIIAYFHDFFYGKTVEKNKPRSFGRKVAYIHACITRLDTLGWLSVYLPVIDELEAAALNRNWFVHGHLLEANGDKSLKFVRHDFKEKPVGLEYKTVQYDEIYALSVEVHRLTEVMNGLLTMVMDLVDKYLPQHLKDSG